MNSNIIAIDGPAGSGKSTVARAVAKSLGWTYLDTGAMYRAVTVVALQQGIDLHDEASIAHLASTLQLELEPTLMANGQNIAALARTSETNEGVSIVAALPRVREVMVERQRSYAASHATGVVVEGRDITTVVFPNAKTKIFLTASLEERARRRGDEDVASVARRDHVDSTRTASPLRQASDASVIDTTGKSIDQVVEEIITCHSNKTSK